MAEEVREEMQSMENPFNVDLSEIQGVSEMFTVQPEEETTTQTQTTEAQTQTTETQTEETNTTESSVTGEETTQQETQSTEDPSSQETEKSSPFTPYAKLVVEEGVLSNFDIDKWDGTPEGLVKGMQDEVQLGINSYKETLDPRVKWLADNVDEGVPFESILSIDKQRLALNAITDEQLENKDVQHNIVREYYKETTKFSDEAINKAIERLESTGDLETETKEFFTQLKDINVQKEQQLREQAVAQRELIKQQEQEAMANLKQNVDSFDEFIPGVKVNAAMKEKVFKGLTTPVDIDPQTGTPVNEIAKARMSDPINFETKLGLVWYYTKGFTDFSAFGSGGKKSAISEFTKAVEGLDLKQSAPTQRTSKPAVSASLVEQMAQISQQHRY